MAVEPRCGAHEARLENLEKWQEKQNGTIDRLDRKLDGAKTWLLITAGGMIANLILALVKLGANGR